MLSHHDLQHLMEREFLPLRCQTTFGIDGAMTVRVTHPKTDEVVFVAAGIATRELTNTRALLKLVGELRQDFAAARTRRAAAGGPSLT
ncbi:DUF1652 domain-containing protein [Pseudomonas sp. HR96]|uniref:DUF1652 domain-containing protein n=1 Tax=Pseudomonas sp. HR96 TaxID=1027966 RepID=UPI002A7561E8|nr:DUF1652 domain-containing protein [Pseudomonas sp. HR96]WPO97791.1 DUF1652 domain-containing protein [Pseudomonas sp. HR96]